MKPTLRIAAIIMALSSLTSFAQAQTTREEVVDNRRRQKSHCRRGCLREEE